MNAEVLQLIDDTTVDDSILGGNFEKIYHQHGSQVNDGNHYIEFYFGENLTFPTMGKAYLDLKILFKNFDRTKFTKTYEIRLVNEALA